MDDEEFYDFEEKIFEELEGKMSDIYGEASLYSAIEKIAKTFNPSSDQEIITRIAKDTHDFYPINNYLHDEQVEDIMINSTDNIFINKGSEGEMKVQEKVKTPQELVRFVKKLNMYATANDANKHIYDIHLPNGSRANVVKSPRGASVTIRNFKKHAFSVIDLINFGELNYNMAARIWLYSEGLKVRPANLLLGGTPGSGKTTLLNAMFSFFRPEERVVVIEDTYELNTETQENCVRLETGSDPYEIRKELNHLMDSLVYVYRKTNELKKAKKGIEQLKKECDSIVVNDKSSVFNTNLRDALETSNLVDLAAVVVEGALRRKESRGAHAMVEYPKRDDKRWLKHTIALKKGRGISISYSPVKITKWQPEERKY